MVEVSTSILSVEEENILSAIYNLEMAKTDYFHIDVMDGIFVENNTNQKMHKFCQNIKQISNIPLDVHLMVKDVKEYIDAYIPYNPNIITFHIEACKDEKEILELINYIKENNIKVGLAIKPKTDIKCIFKYLKYIHMVLIMTVEPGKGGQELITDTIKKVQELKDYSEKNDFSDIDIETDGGINTENVGKLKTAGSNIIVAGSSIINSNSYKETIEKLKM